MEYIEYKQCVKDEVVKLLINRVSNYKNIYSILGII